MIKFEKIIKEIKLIDLYENEYPEEDEMIWNFIGEDDFETEYQIVIINPIDWYKNHKTGAGDMTIEQSYKELAEKEDKRAISFYRKNPKHIKPIIIYENELIDGYHRIVAMALNGITKAEAIDLSQ